MAHEDWTVDRLHVALPHSASRQQLLQDVNLTPLEDLPAVLDGWASAAEQLESARPRIEAARAHMKVRGVLPDDLETRDVTADVLRDTEPRQGNRDDRGRGSGVTYRLHFPTDVFDTYKQLPELARRDLALALVDAQQDPLAYSEPYGQDDGIIRTVAQGHVTAVILLGHDTSTMTVLTIAYAGTA